MTHNRTRLNLESLGDRIVPSTTSPEVGQSGVVNAIYVEGTSDGGVDISNSPILSTTLGGLTQDYVSIPPPNGPSQGPLTPNTLFNPELVLFPKPAVDAPNPIPPSPLPQYAGPDGVKQPPRELSNQEVVKIVQLQLAIKSLALRQEAWEDSVLRAYMRRAELLQAKPVDFEALKANRLEIDMAREEIYILQRKINEMQHAIDTIRLAANQGYPENSIMPPPEVEDRTKIGTADGKFVDIREVLHEMYPVYPPRPDLFS